MRNRRRRLSLREQTYLMIHCDWQRVDAARRGEDEGGENRERVYGVDAVPAELEPAGDAREVLDARNEATETSVARVEAEARDVRLTDEG